MARTLTIVEALKEAIREEMDRDPRVFCIGEDIGTPGGWGGAFTVTNGLSDEYGLDRILDTPIAEIGLAGVAIGASIGGLRPIADVQYGDFLFCMMDQLANQAAKLTYMSGGKINVPMVMRVPVGATTRAAQHSQSLEGLFIHIPGLKVAAPCTAYDAKGLLKTAVRDDNPVMFFEHKLLYGSRGNRAEAGALNASGEVPEEDYTIPFGRGVVRREGTDVTILGKLITVYRAMEAAEILAKDGIEAEVIDPRTLVPFDWDMLMTSIKKTGRLVIVDEEPATGGWAAEIAARAVEKAFDWLDAPVLRVTAPDTPVPFAPEMEQFYLPDARKIVVAVRQII
ncbi:MAG: pyruvate dehydrogenase [Armatimonadetes bacterium RBG_16_58_9]|nr:MAG: pyruvate dehydrogenase [Armatimonadetes bacterium RBG_16_58_9]